jgi:NodT family efflux transporter outer membrane factor (OMF) lipoprotein
MNIQQSYSHSLLSAIRRFWRTPSITLAATLSVFLAGCTAVGTDFEAPTANVPTEWRESAILAADADASDSADWWEHLHDPVLNRLIERALVSGLDVRESFARLREARARRGVTAAEQFPTVEAGASYWRSRESERTAAGALARESDYYSAGLDAAWEIDLSGRVRRAVEAADAELAASVEDTRDVARLLAAETAFVYVELRSYQRRVELARTNVSLQQQTLELVTARFDAGLVGERDLAQAATNVAVTRSRVPALEAGWRAAENRLAVLLGVAPTALANELDLARPIPVPPTEAVVQMPAELVRNRPDVRRAERFAAAEHARIGVAKAELYPRFALSGSLSVSAEKASDLFRSGSDGFGIGPSVRWNLFDRGRLHRQVEVQDARAEQALIQWERTVLVAVEETENAMTGFLRGQSRRESLLEAAAQARHAVELAQFEYNEGLSDFQAVLDSQRALATLDDELAQTDAGIATQFIALQKALGG